MQNKIACAAALLMFAGCTAPAPQSVAPLAEVAPIANAPAPGSMDGTYRGQAIKTASRNRRCGTPGAATFRVINGEIVRRYNPTTILEAKVQPDGSFTAQTGTARLSGRIQGGHMEVDLGAESCAYHYTLDRV